jgi:hypothetical protein
VRIGADTREGEFGHVGLGNDHAAGSAQPPHYGRVGRRSRRIGEHLRAGARRLAGNIEQILDADDGAVERAERYADARSRIRCVGGFARGLRIHREAGAGPLPFRIGDARERLLQAITNGTRRTCRETGRLRLRA